MELLPNELINHIIFDYLYVDEISICLMTSKQLNVLSEKQTNIYHLALLGCKHCLSNNLFESLKLFNKNKLPKINYQQCFTNCCKNGYLEAAQWLYQLNSKEKTIIDIHEHNEIAFSFSCAFGQFRMAEWLYSLDDRINIHAANESAFVSCCKHGQLEMVKWLYQLGYESGTQIDIHADCDQAFINSCIGNHLEVAKFIYSLDDKIDVNLVLNTTDLFVICCRRGYCDILKWIYKLTPTRIDRWELDTGFGVACRHNHLSVIKWLHRLYLIFNLNVPFKGNFECSCMGARIKIAKWLYKKYWHRLDIHVINEKIFEDVCLQGHFKMTKWLHKLDSKAYMCFNKDLAFKINCENGNLKMAQWIYEISSGKINVRANDDYVLNQAVKNGYNWIVEWLFRVEPSYS